MAENNLLARVILYTDGTVHLCLDSRRTFSCTASALHKFLQDPINYIKRDAFCLTETTDFINPQQRKLEKLGYLSLLYLDSKKELSVRFPEVFQYISTIEQSDWDSPINMYNYIQRGNMSDAKGFLLNFYMKFTQSIDQEMHIQNYLDINKDVFYDILREIFNSVFFFEKEESQAVRLDDVVNDVKQKLLVEDTPSDKSDDMISVTEYALKYGLERNAVLKLIHDDKLHNYEKVGREYRVDAEEKPPLTKRQQKNKDQKERRTQEGKQPAAVAGCIEENWSHQELKQHIVANRWYSPVIATYILSWKEFVLYRDNGYRECLADNTRFLIKNIDVDLKDKAGVSNRERMKAGKPPVTLSPDGRLASMELHHLAQRGECYAMVEKHVHQEYYSTRHQNTTADTDQHDAIFDAIKRKFWKWYIQQYEIKNSFDGIKYLFPKHQKKG